jgi:asparagine synthetase B (glutamine-hydrolysing)
LNAFKDLLPKLILNRNNKIGYEAPMDKWMRTNDFIDIMDAMIERVDQPMEKYLNLRYIKKIWKIHKSNKGDYSSEIWKYFYLTKWYNIYFK